MGEDEEEEEMMEELAETEQPLSEEEIVNEVAKRVARRLAEAKKAEKRMNEALGRSKKIINESMDYHDIVLKIERNRRLEKTIMAMQDQSEAIDFIMKKYKCDRDTAQQVLSEIGYYDY
jgi:predicted nucleic acid-binding protein